MSSMHYGFQRGFTMIELMVVIAIIAIMSAIIFGVLSSARNKGGDAAVKSNLVNARSQAEVYYLNSGDSYEGVCATTGLRVVGGMVNAAEQAYKGSVTAYADGTASAWNTGQCHDSTSAWAATVPLKASASGAIVAWCVDSRNRSKQLNATSTILAASGATQYACP